MTCLTTKMDGSNMNEEVTSILKNMKNTSTGWDSISPCIVKQTYNYFSCAASSCLQHVVITWNFSKPTEDSKGYTFIQRRGFQVSCQLRACICVTCFFLRSLRD